MCPISIDIAQANAPTANDDAPGAFAFAMSKRYWTHIFRIKFILNKENIYLYINQNKKKYFEFN